MKITHYVEDSDLFLRTDWLKQMIVERRLVVIENKPCLKEKADVEKEILAYAKKIECFASKVYKDKIDDVWLDILGDDRLLSYLMPKKDRRSCNTMNKYNFFRLLGVLVEKKVYEAEKMTLCKTLEPQHFRKYQPYLSKGMNFSINKV